MTLNEYCEYIKNPLAEVKARVLFMPPGESWTALRRFHQERGSVDLRLSDLVTESAWLPMPDEVFERVYDAMTAHVKSGKTVLLLGLPGYLALLTDENKRTALVALREWVDRWSEWNAVCLLRSDEGMRSLLKDIFANPRYRQGKQLIEIAFEQRVLQFASLKSSRMTVASEVDESAGLPEVTLVADDLAAFIPEACDTFQKYLLYTEEHPNDSTVRRIVVASEGRELPGLSAGVSQIMCLREFARVFYAVDDAGLSEDTLRWMCWQGKAGAEKSLPETLKTLFFPEGEIMKRVLRVFDERQSIECEAVLWLAKHAAPKGSYLARVARQEGVVASNFRSAYVTGAAECLDEPTLYASERRVAIQEAGATMSGADIRQFIAYCAEETTSRVAPWLNCGTNEEHAELLRRCEVDGIVTKAVKDVYPEAAAYLSTGFVFGEDALEAYFADYRELKMTGRVSPEFYAKAVRSEPPSSVQARDAVVQRYGSDNGCALLVVDAMGAEWLPMLAELSRKMNLGVDALAVGNVHLPTTTRHNTIHWPDTARRLPDIKRFDNIVHNGAEVHEGRSSEENLAAALDVIGSEVLPRVADGLARFERVLVTADHGSSRLAALSWQSEPRLARTLPCEEDAEVADWRYRRRASKGGCPAELEETLDGMYWVVRGYDRLPKKGGGQGFELHGGATLEERLVPVVLFSRTGQFVPKAKTIGKRAQIIEKDDFDL